MAFEPCPGCEQAAPTATPSAASQYEATAGDVVTAPGEAVPDGAEADSLDYVITWDAPDTSKEKVGLAVAGGLAFLAPFVSFAVAAKVARKTTGYFKPVGAGALTFFAMRAAAVGVLHFTDNLPAVTAPAAFGAVMPQVPQRHFAPKHPQMPQMRGLRGAPCRGCQ